MTDEELRVRAIQELEFYKKDDTFMLADITVDLAIEALEQNESAEEWYKLFVEKLEQEPCDVFDEYGNYKYPSDFKLTEPNTATSMPCEDAISRQAVLDYIHRIFNQGTGKKKSFEFIQKYVDKLPSVTTQEPKTGHCEECKHFRKLPYHADTLGKCFQHTGFCPKGDWYCADYEPQERSK